MMSPANIQVQYATCDVKTWLKNDYQVDLMV